MELVLIAALFCIATAAFLIWWLVFASEGVYLGPRPVRWLYDLYATRYDSIKENDPQQDFLYLAHPLMLRLPQPDPLVLDVATGTGRLPLALCRHARFEGVVIGVDASLGMLQVAEQQIVAAGCDDQITLMQRPAERLPFGPESFDVVTCLEALEFMPDPAAQLREICLRLRPGGVLLVSQRINTRWYPGRVWDEDTFRTHLHACAITDVEFGVWQQDYTLVWGRKAGHSDWIGPRTIEEVLVEGL